MAEQEIQQIKDPRILEIGMELFDNDTKLVCGELKRVVYKNQKWGQYLRKVDTYYSFKGKVKVPYTLDSLPSDLLSADAEQIDNWYNQVLEIRKARVEKEQQQLKKGNDSDSNDNIRANTDIEATQLFIESNKDYLVKSEGTLWVKQEDGLWASWAEDRLRYLVSVTPITRLTSKGEPYYFNESSSGIDTILKNLASQLKDNHEFINKMWDSNLNCLVFEDGIYDFKKQQFFSFEDYPDEIFPVHKIHKKYLDPVDPVDKEYVNKTFFESIFAEYSEEAKRFFARGLAGMVSDKHWLQIRGERDSGKSQLLNFLDKTFEKYVGWADWKNFMVKKGTDDPSKQYGWLIDFEFKKFMFLSETTTEKKTCLNGDDIKKVTGGDGIQARRLYKDNRKVFNQSRLVGINNDVVYIEPNDALQTCLFFDLPHVFTLNPDPSKPFQKKADETIVDNIKKEKYQKALIHILIESFVNYKPQPSTGLLNLKDDINEDQKQFDDVLRAYYNITLNDDDKVENSVITNLMKDELGNSPQKTNSILFNQYGLKRTTNRKYRLGLVPKNLDEDGN
jgi:phage/plasmid-associated DNA primase